MVNRKVSIVVPIYNVEKYLDRCIQSITNQTYQNLEIILVDDGSTDASSAICETWKANDSRIRIIHKKNGGLSSARNAGLEIATGDYIMFEDSDDWLEQKLVEKCVDRAEEEKSSLVVFGYHKINEQGEHLEVFTFGDGNFNKSQMIAQLYQRILEMSFGYAWNKLYRLSTLRKSGVINDGSIVDREDLYFNLMLLENLDKISYLDYAGYNYLQRETSLLHNANPARLNNVNVFCEKMYQIHIDNKQMQKKVFNMNLLHYLSDCLIKNILWNNALKKKEKIKWMHKVIENCSHLEELYYDEDNPKHLNILFKCIQKKDLSKFYHYVKLSDIKRKITGKI